jgi:hypothetical protein
MAAFGRGSTLAAVPLRFTPRRFRVLLSRAEGEGVSADSLLDLRVRLPTFRPILLIHSDTALGVLHVRSRPFEQRDHDAGQAEAAYARQGTLARATFARRAVVGSVRGLGRDGRDGYVVAINSQIKATDGTAVDPPRTWCVISSSGELLPDGRAARGAFPRHRAERRYLTREPSRMHVN